MLDLEDRLTLPPTEHPPLLERSQIQTPPESRIEREACLPEMTLREAITRFSDSFPFRIRVLQGLYSDSSELNISTDDIYDIHTVKETKIVSVKTEDGIVHRIPLSSAQRFGLIHNPSNNFEKSLGGYNYATIADITSSSVLPKVVCATQEATSADGKVLIEENELLIVGQVYKPLFIGKKGLKVFSITKKTHKTLFDDTAGHFSTKPSLVRLHLPEIIEYVPKPFPSCAVVYSATETASSAIDQPGEEIQCTCI